jgi:phage terminase large subunit
MELVSGARIHVFGAESADNLRGIGLSGVVLDEFASMPPSVWSEIVRPMLSDRGGWCTIIPTPKGRNEFFRIYEEALADPDRWFSF